MRHIILETLGRRVMLAAQIGGSTLVIDGSDANDVIIVGLSKRFVNVATVWQNDVVLANYSVSAFTSIHVTSGGGDDKIWIDSALNPLAYATLIETGDGNDMITTGDGKDVIDAGEGDDKIYANGGDDIIAARGGRDSIWAGGGNDDMNAGLGNDRVNGEAGNDTIEGGKGNDVITGGEGDDSLGDISGADSIAGNEGRDSGVIYSAAIVAGGEGDDGFTAEGPAQLFGEAGNDSLLGARLDGGEGSDRLTGTIGADEIHGGAGDDLIYGLAGEDSLIGDGGNDALFGGGGNDKISGGAGDDNLYGTDGAGDPNKKTAGRDSAFGDAGSDWYETDYQWGRTDRKGEDRPVNAQNPLYQDPDAGKYTSGKFHGGVITGSTAIFGGGSLTLTVDAVNFYSGVTKIGAGMLRLNQGTWSSWTLGGVAPLSQTIDSKSLGPAGTLSSGAYDPASKRFVPPAMTRKERLALGRVVLKLPGDWRLGNVTAARDDVLWFQVWREGAAAPTVPTLTFNGGGISYGSYNLPAGQFVRVTEPSLITVAGTTHELGAGAYVWDGTAFLAAPVGGEAALLVPTLTGKAVVKLSTPHLYDGVQNSAYRFLAVKRGTILVSGSYSGVWEPTSIALNSPVLDIPGSGVDVRIAGSNSIYHPASAYDVLPTGGPKKLRGILVDGGAIWLPTGGSDPYFSSGKS